MGRAHYRLSYAAPQKCFWYWYTRSSDSIRIRDLWQGHGMLPDMRCRDDSHVITTDKTKEQWSHRLTTLTLYFMYSSLSLSFHNTSTPFPEPYNSGASFHKADTNPPWCDPLGEIDVTPQAQGRAENAGEQRELGQTTKMSETQTQKWWPSLCQLR